MHMKLLPANPLARKIAFVTAVKLLGLLAIWWAFFSGQGAGGMTPDQVGAAILHPATSKTIQQ